MKINLKEAKARLRNGDVIAVPTETVYGMAADIASEKAVLNLYNLKGRPSNKPFVIQVSKAKDVLPYLSQVPYDFEKLAKAFWPGPLTLVLPVKEESLSGLVRANYKTAAFRVTCHESTLALLKSYGPLAITSANRSGEKELLSSAQIEEEFGVNFPVLETNENELSGLPSTILAYVDQQWVVLRLGEQTLDKLKNVLGYYPVVVSHFDPKESHYKVRVQLHLMDKPYDGSIDVVLGFEDRKYPNAKEVISMGTLSTPGSIHKKIASILRDVQQQNHPHIWVDLNFAKTGHLKDLAQILERSSRVSV